MCAFKYLLMSILKTAFRKYVNFGCEWIPWWFVKSKSKRLSHEEDVTYHIKIATFPSMKWLWIAWSLEGSQAYIKMEYLSTTNLKWQFYRICSKWFNVATLHPACTKVPGLHKSTRPAQKYLTCTKVPGLHKSTWPAQKYLACTKIPGLHKSTWPAQKYLTCTKVPGLHKLQHTSLLQEPNIFSCQEFTFPNFASATSSTNPWVVRNEGEILIPFLALASTGSTLWSLNYVLTYLKI